MGRRKKPDTLMRDAIDKRNPYDFCWALLEISMIEFKDKKKFDTLSTTDIKNLLQALIQSGNDIPNVDEHGKKATLSDIEKYLNSKK